MSETGVTEELVAALARAQGAFPAIAKGHTNPHYKSKYADLSDVLAAVRPVLAAEGIAISQPIRTKDDGRSFLLTELLGHGGVYSSAIPLDVAGLKPQELGSTLTYLRRYTLAAMLGVAAEDDDDGNAAQSARPRVTFELTDATAELVDVAQSREAVQEAIAELSDADKELVKLECRNQRVPSLRKPGATRVQLDGLVEFIAGLRERAEPFDPQPAPGHVPPTPPGPPAKGFVRTEPTAAEFVPVVAGRAVPGSRRLAVDSAMKATPE